MATHTCKECGTEITEADKAKGNYRITGGGNVKHNRCPGKSFWMDEQRKAQAAELAKAIKNEAPGYDASKWIVK